jgi:hypothetical protein
MAKKIKLGELAKFLRSKNAGPFKLTLDVFFNNSQDYKKVKESGVINKAVQALQFRNRTPSPSLTSIRPGQLRSLSRDELPLEI